MTSLLASAALLLAAQTASSPAPTPAPLAAQPQLSLEQATGLRCGVAFALVAQAQQRGEGAQYPALGTRGREYFVRYMAQLMDANGLTREAVSALVLRETRAMAAAGPDAVGAVMPACLQLLDLSGL